ncbi:hypothetical protein CEP51_013960, partial [Fusarium floridanum]
MALLEVLDPTAEEESDIVRLMSLVVMCSNFIFRIELFELPPSGSNAVVVVNDDAVDH